MQVTLDIPDTLAAQLAAAGKDPARAALEALALEGYRTRRLSESGVRRMLGLETRFDVHALLADHGVCLNYSLEDWKHDKRIVDELHEERLAAKAAEPETIAAR